MTKAVMMSIQPKWVEKILNGEKTIEVRKTAPKLETPFKVYVYCTKDMNKHLIRWYGYDRPTNRYDILTTKELHDEGIVWGQELNGKVVAEFTCDRIECAEQYDDFVTQYVQYPISAMEWEQTCLTYKELTHYGNGKPLYLWHISDLKIYDKPRELEEFYKKMSCFVQGDYDKLACWECCEFYDRGECDGNGEVPLTRPPQSWCYVEESDR